MADMLREALQQIEESHSMIYGCSGQMQGDVLQGVLERLWHSVEILRASLSAVPEKEVMPTVPLNSGASVTQPGVESGSGQESIWRVVSKVYVYRGDTPICHCHTPEDTAAIVEAMNETIKARVLDKFADHLDKAHVCHQTLSREEAEKMAAHALWPEYTPTSAGASAQLKRVADALQRVAGEEWPDAFRISLLQIMEFKEAPSDDESILNTIETHVGYLTKQLAEAQQARQRAEVELNATWTDEDGTVWTRPTPWAYAQACKSVHKLDAANALLRRVVDAFEHPSSITETLAAIAAHLEPKVNDAA